MSPYDPSNIFAKILRGEVPCYRLHEDEHTLAFMDIMPITDGHCLVIPKRPSRNLLDANPAVFGPLMATVQKVASAVKTAFAADGIQIQQSNEAASGQTVYHLHVHVIPRTEGVALTLQSSPMGDKARLEANAEKIRRVLAG